MLDPTHPIAELLRRDKRYHFDAYVFVFEALRYAHDKLGMGARQPSEWNSDDPRDCQDSGCQDLGQQDLGMGARDPSMDDPDALGKMSAGGTDEEVERHVSGQELCEAMRLYAQEQYGYLAKNVLNHWGLGSTSDFGEIVFNLIEIGQMRKTANDTREDFDGVFDFDEGFQHSYQISLPDSTEERRS